MALPTIPGYWTSRRNVYEQAIVNRRNHESDYREKWSAAADHFQKMDIEASKKNMWTSNQSFQDSMDAYKTCTDKDIKALNLKRRRSQLADMLQSENKRYEAELRGYSTENFDKLTGMKLRAEGLKSAREEKRKNVAQEKLYEHWRQNNPDIRRMETDMLQENVIKTWPNQVEEQKEKLESARREEERYDREMEEERRMAMEAQKQKEGEKLDEEKRLKDVLKEQMEELRRKTEESSMLKCEQEKLENEQLEIAQIEEKRKQTESNRKKQEFGRILLRQHKAQLMRRSRKIQEELEEDRRLLECLIEKENDDLIVMTSRKEKARADAKWMKQVIDDQLQVEKAREAELDMLYQDEAARMWQKREAEWEREKQARERLMQEVLASRQDQLVDKMEELRLQQEESFEMREQLVKEMEVANQLTQRERKQHVAAKEEFKLNLDEQLKDHKEREFSAREREVSEFKAERAAEEDYDEILQQETHRIKLHGYTPRNHGRKQAWT